MLVHVLMVFYTVLLMIVREFYWCLCVCYWCLCMVLVYVLIVLECILMVLTRLC